jgi:ABC-type oligopeptide transport system substrate-binding subunit
VSFVSNPAYASRPGRGGRPHIREIRFYVSKDPVKDLKEGRLDLALDLTAAQATALARESKFLVPPPGPNRRVWFLAVNHQPGSALANAAFRRGLALAIHREELLDQYFRPGLGKEVHKALNSPFPAGCWASKQAAADKSLDPFDPKLAEGLTATAGNVTLTLKYPTGDPRVADALKDLRKQVLAVTKERVTLELVPLEPHELRKAVEDRNYQLAYWHYDFPDETYWLAPLLGQDGDNLMQYHGSQLEKLIRDAAARREFDKVREQVREMNRLLDGEMPLIPLWQLDPLSAYREDLKPTSYDRGAMGPRKEVEKVPFDPLLVFTDVENWSLERQ